MWRPRKRRTNINQTGTSFCSPRRDFNNIVVGHVLSEIIVAFKYNNHTYFGFTDISHSIFFFFYNFINFWNQKNYRQSWFLFFPMYRRKPTYIYIFLTVN